MPTRSGLKVVRGGHVLDIEVPAAPGADRVGSDANR